MADFSAGGERHWTRARFEKKSNGIAKTILAAAGKKGRVPDFVAVQEVENRRVLRSLLADTPLRKMDWKVVHFDSPDRRGIDCGLLYRCGRMQLLRSYPCHIRDSLGRVLPTRDILLAEFRLPSGERVSVLVNHHPSKLGRGSSVRRALAFGTLRHLCDSLFSAGCSRVVAVGDFNTPVEWADPLCRGGTIRFNGVWERIDGCAVCLGTQVREEVLDFPFLLTRDIAHGGKKPARTYSGPRYLGGISDHLPVGVWF